MSFNYTAPAERAGGTRAVLKIGFPGDKEFRTELEALQVFDGHGMVQLLEADASAWVMLLERIEPGTPLSEIPSDEQAIAIATDLMQQFWRPAPANHTFPLVTDWGKGFQRLRQRFNGATGPLPAELVARAEALFIELAESQATPVLLHGDLNYGNVLEATRQSWLAIDPKGVVGEPAYETGVLLRDQFTRLMRHSNPGLAMARRIDHLAEALQVDRERIRGWGLAQAVLSAWWSIEDNSDGVEEAIACAEMLASLPTTRRRA